MHLFNVQLASVVRNFFLPSPNSNSNLQTQTIILRIRLPFQTDRWCEHSASPLFISQNGCVTSVERHKVILLNRKLKKFLIWHFLCALKRNRHSLLSQFFFFIALMLALALSTHVNSNKWNPFQWFISLSNRWHFLRTESRIVHSWKIAFKIIEMQIRSPAESEFFFQFCFRAMRIAYYSCVNDEMRAEQEKNFTSKRYQSLP